MQRLKLSLPHHWVLIISFLFLIVPLIGLELPILQYSKGIFIYSYDEAYIRMATAKNLALHGTWGLWSTDFSSASSSIFFPLLLAALYKVFGVKLIIPFLINGVTALLLIWIIQRWLFKQGLSPWGQLVILLVIILLTPLSVLVVMGMEHTLQVLFTFLFIVQLNEWLVKDNRQYTKHRHLPGNLYFLGMSVTTIRYEGLFVVAIACLTLVTRRRLLACIELGLVSLLPLILFGLYSVEKGGHFIPDSLLVKAIPLPLDWDNIRKFFTSGIVSRLIYSYNTPGAVATGRLLILLPLIYGLFISRLRGQRLYTNILLFCFVTTILHLIFSSAILFYRYEAYLIAVSLLISGVLIFRYGRVLWPPKGYSIRWVVVWATIFLIYPFLSRGYMAYKDVGTECLNIYEQDYQAAAFIHRFYNDAVVITDGIGAASYLSDGKKLDLYSGIGYLEAARAKVQSYYQLIYIKYLINKEQPVLAIISEDRYPAALMLNWVKVADWYTDTRVILGNTQLSFYAPNESAASILKENLKAFESYLPAGVKPTYP